MVDILHKVGVRSSADRVYTALTTLEGLRSWWTTDTRGEASKRDATVEFYFNGKMTSMKVVELEPGKRVVWEVVSSSPEWVGTKIRFDLKQIDQKVELLFKHEGWREPTEFMHACSTKWGAFLISLKTLCEGGKGAPFPHDMQVFD